MKKNILIFPAGTEIALEIVNALKYSKFVEIFGGTSVNDHSEFAYKNVISGFPFVDNAVFLEYLNTVIEKYNIDCVYPAHDSVSVFLSNNMDSIKAQVIISDKLTTNICRSKIDTYKYFEEYDFVPKVYNSIDDVEVFPVFIKPSVGQGSVGATKIDSKEELIVEQKKNNNVVICEYLSGTEYTVDCFTNKAGELLVSILRDRQRIKAGISVRSEVQILNDAVKEIATVINKKLCFKGAWFFQLKKNILGNYKLLEISPRISGTMGLSRNLGINFPMLTLFTFWEYDIEIIKNDYSIVLDKAFYSAYKISCKYNHVYLDFDDTLIVNENVNLNVLCFLYQAKYKMKKIHLLSKHRTNIYDDLKKYYIATELFDSIETIAQEENKSDYIIFNDSIFIDDSFAERKKVYNSKKIPVFDVDMVECLLEWKV